jgi:hypothetical protein
MLNDHFAVAKSSQDVGIQIKYKLTDMSFLTLHETNTCVRKILYK